MQYIVRIDGNEVPVCIEELAPGHFALVIDGQKVEVQAAHSRPGQLDLAFGPDGIHRQSAFVEGERVWVEGWELHGEVLDLRTLALKQVQERSAAKGPLAIRTPMPGRVAAVLVKEGQAVCAGEGLVVVEAMKMENELRAPKDGVVRDLAAYLGDQVPGGAILCAVH